MSNETEELIEAPHGEAKSHDSVLNEANSGKAALVDEQKEYSDYLKAGGKSGITEEFGKPVLLDHAERTGVAATGDRAAKPADGGDHNVIADTATAIVNGVGVMLQEATHAVVDTVGRALGAFANWFGGGDHADAPEPVSPGDLKMPPPVTAKPPYLGEGLKIDLPATIATGAAGDTLDSIALKTLPPGTTPDVLEQYKKEIAQVNELDLAKPGNLDGKQLCLPGHATDGSLSILDANQRTTTRRADGSETTVDADSRMYERKPDGAGGFKETHSGPRPEDAFELTTTKDGKLLIADKPGDTPREVKPASELVNVERRKLENLAEEKIADPEKRAKFKADMLRFEERAAKENPAISASEISKTYRQAERLLSATGNKPLKEAERLNVAEQAMSQCARPTSIDQGGHETCNMTTVECKTYTDHPAAAMKLVTDVATTGEYTGTDGTHVKINPAAADAESKENPPADGDRSHASLIFQVTAVNLYYQQQPLEYTDARGLTRYVPPGKVEYKQVPDKPGTVPPSGGERLIDHTTDPPTTIMKDWVKKIPEDSPSIDDRAMVDVPVIITGKHDTVMIANEHDANAPGVTTFKTEEEMKDAIKQAKDENKMPVIFKVHSGQEPFFHDSGDGKAGGSGGWHVVTITDYDPKTGKAKVDNQWGSSSDHLKDGVSARDLFLASRDPAEKDTQGAWYKPWDGTKEVNATISELQKDVDSNRAHNKIDTEKELDLIRLKHEYGGMSNADFVKQLGQTIDESGARWTKQRADHTFDSKEYDSAQSKLNDMVGTLSPSRRIDMVNKMHAQTMIDDATFSDKLGDTTAEFFASKHGDEEAGAYMTKLKGMTDAMPPAEQAKFYDTANDNADAKTRLELLEFENKSGAISDSKCDDAIARTVEDYMKVKAPAAEVSAFAKRFWTVMNSLPETRRNGIVKKIPIAPARV